MKLYIISGNRGSGKSVVMTAIKHHYARLGLKVASFPKYRSDYSACYYQQDEYMTPANAFVSLGELSKNLPTGYDVGVIEYLSSDPATPGDPDADHILGIPAPLINEISGNPPINNNTNKIYSNTEAPVDGAFTVTAEYLAYNVDQLVSFDIRPQWTPPTFSDVRVISCGYVPPEYRQAFPDMTIVGTDRFVSECAAYDLAFIAPTSGRVDLPTNAPRILCFYPPALLGREIWGTVGAKDASIYPDVWFNIFADVPSVSFSGSRVILNGLPPLKTVVENGWFESLGVM